MVLKKDKTAAINKNYMSIGVSVRTTTFATSNPDGHRDGSTGNRPQSAMFHTGKS